MSPRVPLACDLSVLQPAERKELKSITRKLVPGAIDLRPTADGYAFQLPVGHYDTVVRFVALERLCCPFLRFTLELTPTPVELWLQLAGPPGAREFLRAELRIPPPAGR